MDVPTTTMYGMDMVCVQHVFEVLLGERRLRVSIAQTSVPFFRGYM